MLKLGNILDMDIKKLSTLLSLGCILNTLFGLKDEGVNTSFVDLFIPAIATNFGGGLIANLVYKQSSLTVENISIFFIGLLIFTVIHRISPIRYTTKICPIIGRSLSFVSLKNSKTPFHLIFGSLFAAEVTGKLINKLLFNKTTIEMSQEDLTRNFVLIMSIAIGRRLNLSNITYFSFIFFVSIFPLMTEFIKNRAERVKDINKNKKKTLKSQLQNSITK